MKWEITIIKKKKGCAPPAISAVETTTNPANVLSASLQCYMLNGSFRFCYSNVFFRSSESSCMKLWLRMREICSRSMVSMEYLLRIRYTVERLQLSLRASQLMVRSCCCSSSLILKPIFTIEDRNKNVSEALPYSEITKKVTWESLPSAYPTCGLSLALTKNKQLELAHAIDIIQTSVFHRYNGFLHRV